MRRVARWCATHRLAVVAAWIAVLVGTVYLSSSTGSNYSNGSKLSGTQSATAQDLLKKASPGAAGDTEQIVFATHGQAVTSPTMRAQIQPMLAKVRAIAECRQCHFTIHIRRCIAHQRQRHRCVRDGELHQGLTLDLRDRGNDSGEHGAGA